MTAWYSLIGGVFLAAGSVRVKNIHTPREKKFFNQLLYIYVPYSKLHEYYILNIRQIAYVLLCNIGNATLCKNLTLINLINN